MSEYDNPFGVGAGIHDQQHATDVGFHTPMPNPTEAMLADPLWHAIWSAIKSWDVNVPESYGGYCEANGSHATIIFNAIQAATPTHQERGER